MLSSYLLFVLASIYTNEMDGRIPPAWTLYSDSNSMKKKQTDSSNTGTQNPLLSEYTD